MGLMRKLWTSKSQGDAATSIERIGDIWYDSNDGVLRRSDGITPGGIIMAGGGSVPIEEMVYTKRIDFISDDLLYKGEAVPGTAESAALWRIVQISFGADGDATFKWAGGAATFDKIWNDRISYQYI